MYAANEEWKRRRGGRKEGKKRKMIVLVSPSSCLIKLETVGQMQKKGEEVYICTIFLKSKWTICIEKTLLLCYFVTSFLWL